MKKEELSFCEGECPATLQERRELGVDTVECSFKARYRIIYKNSDYRYKKNFINVCGIHLRKKQHEEQHLILTVYKL